MLWTVEYAYVDEATGEDIPIRIFDLYDSREAMARGLGAYWVGQDGEEYPVHLLTMRKKGNAEKVGIPLTSGVSGVIAGDISDSNMVGMGAAVGVAAVTTMRFKKENDAMASFNGSDGLRPSDATLLKNWRVSLDYSEIEMVQFLNELFGDITVDEYREWEAGTTPIPSIIVIEMGKTAD